VLHFLSIAIPFFLFLRVWLFPGVGLSRELFKLVFSSAKITFAIARALYLRSSFNLSVSFTLSLLPFPMRHNYFSIGQAIANQLLAEAFFIFYLKCRDAVNGYGFFFFIFTFPFWAWTVRAFEFFRLNFVPNTFKQREEKEKKGNAKR
jgi:hypothetical protein